MVAASGLLYEAMGMTPRDPSHTQTHISECCQNSHAFFPPPTLPLASPPPQPPRSLLSLVAGKVLIDFFPKLFLIKDKQIIHISWRDLGLPRVSGYCLKFSLCSSLCSRERCDRRSRTGWKRGGVETDGCSENNTSATSKWETWEVRL